MRGKTKDDRFFVLTLFAIAKELQQSFPKLRRAAMLSGDRFRFSLQWGNDTEEKILAGQLLNWLGNKKSEVVVMALTEYIQAHPELAVPGGRLQVVVRPTHSEQALQAMVKDLAKKAVGELMAGMPIRSAECPTEAASSGPSQDDLNVMLSNLSLFS